MKLSAAKKTEIANHLRAQIDASIASRSGLIPVWTEIRKMQKAVATDTNVQIVEGMRCEYFSVYRPKRNLTVSATYAAVTGLSPYVQARDVSQGGTNVDFAEETLQNMAERANFDRQFRDALGWGVDVNLGTLRVRPLVNDDGDVTGVECESIPPMRMVAWPTGFPEYEKCTMVGHCYYDLAYRVKERCHTKSEDGVLSDDGFYDCDPDLIIGGGSDPSETSLSNIERSGYSPTKTDEVLDPMESYIKIFDVVTEIDPEDTGKRTRHVITYNYDNNLIMNIQPYGAEKRSGKLDAYPSCWYVEFKALWESDEGIWPIDSVGRPVLGPQFMYNMMWNSIVQGGAFAAFGFHLVSGNGFKTQLIKMKPGGMYEMDGDFKVESLEFPFNPQSWMAACEKIEEIVDSLMGRTQLGTGQNLPASTSATAVHALQQAQSEAKDAYIDAFAPSVAKVWKILWEYLKLHYGTLKKAMPDDIAIPGGYESIKDLTLSFQVTGQSGASNPQGLLAKLQAILTILGTPIQLPPGSIWDPDKIIEKIIETLDLPFAPKQLMKDLFSNSAEALHDILKQLLNEGFSPEEIKIKLQQLAIAAQQQQAQQALPPPNGQPQAQPVPLPQQAPQPGPAQPGPSAGNAQAPGVGVSPTEAAPASGIDDGGDSSGHIS